jgi:hypothetical protein
MIELMAIALVVLLLITPLYIRHPEKSYWQSLRALALTLVPVFIIWVIAYAVALAVAALALK